MGGKQRSAQDGTHNARAHVSASGRYPWQQVGSAMLIEAARESDRYRFPYRSIMVRETEQGAAASSATIAPSFPPEQIGRTQRRSFGTLAEAMAWAEGVYDEALGRC